MTTLGYYIPSTDLEATDSIELASSIYCDREQAKRLLEQADRASLVLLRRMEANNQRELEHPGLTVRLEIPSPKYDYGVLNTLAELLEPETIATARTPAHEVTTTVAESWDGRVLQHWPKRHGTKVAEVLERAKLPSDPPRLKITPKP